MQITKVKLPESRYGLKCPNSMEPTAITVHNTANDASAMMEISYMQGNSSSTSFHAAVDDYRIVEGLPFDRNGWHSGDGNGPGNRKTIGIEICYSLSGGERFEKAERLAAEYIAYLLAKRGWGIDCVKKHQDWSGKYCPHRTLDLGWQRFLGMIQSYLDNGSPDAPSSGTYTVQIGDTLSKIAGAHGCTYKDLMAINPQISDPNVIHVGDVIVLPGGTITDNPAPAPAPTPAPRTVDVYYRVATAKHGWLPEVTNLEDYAGWQDSPVTKVAIRVSAGRIKYRVHIKGGKWLPWVEDCDINDHKNGYAGNGKPIDAIALYYYTPSYIRPYRRAKYRVAAAGRDYYPWQLDNQTTNGQDGYAGAFGRAIMRLQIAIV